ncbi:ATP-grasp domain-containing protein [Vibrio coralliirubri]|uniref:ATP-grasp domain-containing protein n=1 Tax=Vibrio coralliirubri TaxID=1516159 RepID=UPI000769B86E|nr:ATP-grasp domain-containing protein [Vibrio coralliirubri]
MNLLFTCVGRRKYLIDYFKCESDFVNKVVGADMSLTAPALHSCDESYQVPSIYDSGYIDEILSICKKERINFIISLNDMELPILIDNQERFSDIGVSLALSNEKVINICSDKYMTYEFGLKMGIPVPKTYIELGQAIVDIDNKCIKFPLIVKPRWGSASFGLYIVNTIGELEESYRQCHSNLSTSYLSQFKKSHQDVIIQEFIEGSEYGVDIFNDLKSTYHGFVAKKKLSMRSGETDKATTVSPRLFLDSATKIGKNLGHIGNLDCDFMERDGEMLLLELNPRFGGGYPFSHEAGANLVKCLLLSMCDRDDEISINYSSDLTFSKCDTIVPATQL